MKNGLQKATGGFDLFDAFDDFFRPMFYDESKELRTDIRETEKNYELDVEMPGYEKGDIKVTLENGYLTVGAEKHSKEEEGKYVRREISRSCQRSFYVGTDLSEGDVQARYDNGILSLSFPKDTPRKDETHLIDIM